MLGAADQIEPREKMQAGHGSLPCRAFRVFPLDQHGQDGELHQEGQSQENPRNEMHGQKRSVMV